MSNIFKSLFFFSTLECVKNGFCGGALVDWYFGNTDHPSNIIDLNPVAGNTVSHYFMYHIIFASVGGCFWSAWWGQIMDVNTYNHNVYKYNHKKYKPILLNAVWKICHKATVDQKITNHQQNKFLLANSH